MSDEVKFKNFKTLNEDDKEILFEVLQNKDACRVIAKVIKELVDLQVKPLTSYDLSSSDSDRPLVILKARLDGARKLVSEIEAALKIS